MTNKTLKDIMPIKEWDWFGIHKESQYKLVVNKEIINTVSIKYEPMPFCWSTHTLADLLANKSWCKAVWGERLICSTCGVGYAGEDCCQTRRKYREDGMCSELSAFRYYSVQAFQLLREGNEQACIDYIYKTKLN